MESIEGHRISLCTERERESQQDILFPGDGDFIKKKEKKALRNVTFVVYASSNLATVFFEVEDVFFFFFLRTLLILSRSITGEKIKV